MGLQGIDVNCVISLGLATLLGCGPPAPSNTGATTSSTSESTDESTESTTDDSTESTTDETTESTTDSNDDFVPEDDIIDPNGCDHWEMDCPVGEKCVPYSTSGTTWDASKCVPVIGDQQPGEPCLYGGTGVAWDDCDADSFCFFAEEVDGELIGECIGFCTGTEDSPMCPEGYSCMLASDGVVFPCIELCDPLAQDCPLGQACFWGGVEFSCIGVGEDLPTGSACQFLNDCAAGNLCVASEYVPDCGPDDDGCCTAFCDLVQMDLDCAPQPGTTCVPFYEDGMAPPGYETVGICTLP